MQSRDVVGGNVEKIAALFPHCITERLNKDGKPERAIDFDKLLAELSNEVLDDGTVVRRKYIDYTVNTDERICDGFYYATTLKHLKRLLSHPEQLDKPAPVVNHDVD